MSEKYINKIQGKNYVYDIQDARMDSSIDLQINGGLLVTNDGKIISKQLEAGKGVTIEDNSTIKINCEQILYYIPCDYKFWSIDEELNLYYHDLLIDNIDDDTDIHCVPIHEFKFEAVSRIDSGIRFYVVSLPVDDVETIIRIVKNGVGKTVIDTIDSNNVNCTSYLINDCEFIDFIRDETLNNNLYLGKQFEFSLTIDGTPTTCQVILVGIGVGEYTFISNLGTFTVDFDKLYKLNFVYQGMLDTLAGHTWHANDILNLDLFRKLDDNKLHFEQPFICETQLYHIGNTEPEDIDRIWVDISEDEYSNAKLNFINDIEVTEYVGMYISEEGSLYYQYLDEEVLTSVEVYNSDGWISDDYKTVNFQCDPDTTNVELPEIIQWFGSNGDLPIGYKLTITDDTDKNYSGIFTGYGEVSYINNVDTLQEDIVALNRNLKVSGRKGQALGFINNNILAPIDIESKSDNDIFIAIYDETSLNDIVSAYEQGYRMFFCKDPVCGISQLYGDFNDVEICFRGFEYSNFEQVKIHTFILNNDGWSIIDSFTYQISNGKCVASLPETLTQDATIATIVKVRNVLVNVEDWVEDSRSLEFPFTATINVNGMTSDHVPMIQFSIVDYSRSILSPVSQSFDGGVYIFSKEIPETSITIDNIVGLM